MTNQKKKLDYFIQNYKFEFFYFIPFSAIESHQNY